MVFCGSFKLVVVASMLAQLASSHAVNPAPFAKWSLMMISPPLTVSGANVATITLNESTTNRADLATRCCQCADILP